MMTVVAVVINMIRIAGKYVRDHAVIAQNNGVAQLTINNAKIIRLAIQPVIGREFL